MANVSNTSPESQIDDFTTYKEYKAGILIWKIVPPVLIILGTAGNCLSIIVLTRRCIRTSTTALYLTVLAFSDLVVLYSGLLRQWLIHLFEIDVRTFSEFGCKLNIWLVYSSLDYSAWILIVVTLERVISAWLPHNYRTLCTKKSALALLISVGVFILCLNAHLLYGMVFVHMSDENGNTELRKCVETNDDYYEFFNVTWPWIDFCAFSLIPFSVIVIGNALILFKVIKSQRKVKSRVVPSVQGGNRQPAATHHGNKQSSMTAMLFTLNVVFLLSTSPISIYNIGYTYWIDGASEHEIAVLDLWWAIVNMMMYVNNSLNFLLYCLSGTKFRLEVIRIFCSWRHRTGAGNMQMAPQSNYSRTKFDTPSATPSPRNSALFTVNTPFSNSSNQIAINGEKHETANQTGTKSFKHSNNSLHPNDAIQIASTMSGSTENCVKSKDNLAANNETSETIVLSSCESKEMATSQANTTDKTVKLFETKTATDTGISQNNVSHNTNADASNPNANAEYSTEEKNTSDVTGVTSQTDNTETDEKNMIGDFGNPEKNSDSIVKDSTV